MFTSRRIKMNVQTLLLFLAFSISQINTGVAQEYDHKHNSVYGSLGTLIFVNQASISYERTISASEMVIWRIKINYGQYTSNGLDLETDEKEYKNHKGVSAVFLFGLFEANFGFALTQYTLASGFNPRPNVDYTEVINGKSVYIASGIRYEKNNFLVRAGFSNLEYLYAGVGINF